MTPLQKMKIVCCIAALMSIAANIIIFGWIGILVFILQITVACLIWFPVMYWVHKPSRREQK